MNGSKRLILMVLVGVLVAAGIIVSVSALEGTGVITNSSSIVTTTATSFSTTISTTTQISNSPQPTGTLAVQLTDPPNVPIGTTHLYVKYGDIEAHSTGLFGNESVWFTLAKGGQIDLMSTVNSSITVGSARVSVGTYDMARIAISNATATFAGKNYTIVLPQSQILGPIIQGGLSVQTNTSSGFVLQLSPTLIAQQNGNSTAFAMVFGVRGIPIPQSQWDDSLAKLGSQIGLLQTKSWWSLQQTRLQGNLTFISELLSNNSLLLVLENTGTVNVSLSGVSVLTSGPSPGSLQTVATFVILNNGSIVQQGARLIQATQISPGLVLRPNQTVNLLFVGGIQTLDSIYPPYSQLSIVPNQHYILQVEETFGSTKGIGATFCCGR
ncbi:MAG TPA: DUF4382 domain-containing protein [Nitrososphaerales archaeon]|nr:DUF4382 domain-containing protein [Nitrososphaerales archaeon]